MNSLFRLAPLALLLAVVGCDSTAPQAVQVGAQAGEIEVPIGQSASLDGVQVSFDSIVEDTRCPEGVDCFWEGRASVGVTIGTRTYEMLVSNPELAPENGVQIDSRLVFATRLTPEPSETSPSDDTPVVTLAAFATR